MSKQYKRQIAIFTDVHSLIDPLESILNDIKTRGIKEIYSLGDNIGAGPNPNEVIELLKKNNVKSVAGNAEYYATIGVAPFMNYFSALKIASRDWTNSKITDENMEFIKKLPSTIEIELGGKKIALCHFTSDTRIDFVLHSTWAYQDAIEYGDKAYELFYYTNSDEQKKDILKNKDNLKAFYDGFRSSYIDPLFFGKSPFEYDYVIQGHVHFKSIVKSPTTIFYTVGMAYCEKNKGTYIILNEKEEGFDIEEVYVTFDRNKMLERIEKSDMPDKLLISKYIRE